MHDDEVAINDVLVDHGLALDLEGVVGSAARQQLIRHGQGLSAHDGFDRTARRHPTKQRDLRGPGLPLGRKDLDGPAFIMSTVDVPLALEIGQMLVHRRQRLKAEMLGDLLEAWRVAAVADMLLQVLEDLALTLGERHGASRFGTERIPN